MSMSSTALPLALLLGAAAACRPGPVKPADTRPLPEAAAVLAELRARAAGRASLRTEGRVEYFGDKGRVRLKAVLLARRPGSFRIETLSPFEQPIDVMACDGTRLWLLSKDRLRTGLATPENIARLLPLVMGPEAVVDTLLGGLPGADGVQATGIERDEDDRWRLSVTTGAERGRLVVDPPSKQIREMHLLEPDGAIRVRVRFDDFEAQPGGGEFPTRIRVNLPAEDAEVTLRWRAPEIDVDIADALFRLEAPPGVTPEPLGVR